jgi:hypothetical protein
MRNSGNILLWIVGLVMAAIATWQFYLFVAFKNSQGLLEAQGGTLHLWLAVGAAVMTCLCAFVGIFRRINKNEELHITS